VLDLLTRSHPDDPALDIAISGALLRQVGEGRRGSVLRIFRPGPTVAFGRLDAHRAGFGAARDAARDHGFTPVVRAAGGHAAAYDERSLVVEHITREQDSIAGLQGRFEAQSALIVDALRELGVDARVGELPREYCPGAHSVNAGGRVKVAGIAQRAIRNAAMTSAVVVAGGGGELRAVIEDVYAALGLTVDPATVGATDEEAPGAGIDAVERAVRDAYARVAELVPAAVDPSLVDEARRLLPRHAA
jgi:octanoyl-[GcvH]:protein N-octanoyltransferase